MAGLGAIQRRATLGSVPSWTVHRVLKLGPRIGMESGEKMQSKSVSEKSSVNSLQRAVEFDPKARAAIAACTLVTYC